MLKKTKNKIHLESQLFELVYKLRLTHKNRCMVYLCVCILPNGEKQFSITSFGFIDEH